jgi:hypothetical protein
MKHCSGEVLPSPLPTYPKLQALSLRTGKPPKPFRLNGMICAGGWAGEDGVG